jgi:hypothetical protein
MVDALARPDHVGPVLHAGRLTDAVIEAIRERTPDVVVVDRGSYLRVLAPGRCVLAREAVERQSRTPFRLPSELEAIRSSMKGRLVVTDDEARWELPTPGSRPSP